MKAWMRRLTSVLIDWTYIAMTLGSAKRPASHLYRRILGFYYRKQAERYDQTVIAAAGELYGQAFDVGLKKILVRPQRILDVNTGTGYVALRLKRTFPDAAVVGTDISTQMLEQAREKARQENLEVAFLEADGAQLPFSENEFDLVALQNAPLYIAEIVRVLRPGGQLLIAYTSGALVPKFWRARLQRELEKIRVHRVETVRRGDGFCILVTK